MSDDALALPEPSRPLAAAARRSELAIWGFALGYFACYVPYAALTKLLTEGLGPLDGHAIPGAQLLPAAALASTLGALGFLTAMRWWSFARHVELGPVRIPCPSRWTLLSGLASAVVIVTTTLAYSFRGISIVFMVLLMKGGVLVIAPVVDAIGQRSVRWFSWLGLFLSVASLAVTFSGGSLQLSLAAAVDVIAYLAAYFIRLSVMSHLGKTTVRAERLRYFVEEHMVASPALLAMLFILAALGDWEIRDGFLLLGKSKLVAAGFLVGLLSEGTGIFGGLILLDPRENTFAVPVNRASSILAGVVATGVLGATLGLEPTPIRELLGAGLVLLAVGVLAAPSLFGHSHSKPVEHAREGRRAR